MLLRKISSIILPSTSTNVVATSAACGVGGTLLRFLLDPMLPPGVPFPTFWVAADIATVVAGWRAGSLTVLLGAVAGWYFWLEPRNSFALSPDGAFVIALFITLAGVQVFIAEMMREALVRAERLRAERDLVVRELVHRIRNHFALFNSIAIQTLRSSPDLAGASDALQGRLRALMIGLDLAAAEGTTSFELTDLVRQVVEPLAPGGDRLRIEAISASVPQEQVHAIALVLHELGTNAIKYGAWSGTNGAVWIAISRPEGRLLIQWIEQGLDIVAPANAAKGFGTVLITRAIPDAEVTFQPGPPYTVTIALSS